MESVSSFYDPLPIHRPSVHLRQADSITFAGDLGRWKLKYSTSGCCNDRTVSSSALSAAEPTRRVALLSLVEATQVNLNADAKGKSMHGGAVTLFPGLSLSSTPRADRQNSEWIVVRYHCV